MEKVGKSKDYRVSRVKVTDKIKDAIYDLIIEGKDIEKKKKHSAKWYRGEVAKELTIADKDNPSLRSYEAALQPMRKALQVKNLQDGPWCLASLSKYPLPVEAIPIILEVQHNVQSHRSPEAFDVLAPQRKLKVGQPVTGPFTIREAQWVARLSFIADWSIVSLEHWAHAYAIGEHVSEVMGRDFDSSNMDSAILKERKANREGICKATR